MCIHTHTHIHAYTQHTHTFRPLNKLQDNCVVTACGNDGSNFLLVLGINVPVEKLNEELKKKKEMNGLKKSYTEIKEYRCFTQGDIQAKPALFSSCVRKQCMNFPTRQ